MSGAEESTGGHAATGPEGNPAAATGASEEVDFAQVLRTALQRSPLSLASLSTALSVQGSPVTPATLSYWSQGRSRPQRRSSVAVVQNLESLLELEPGELLSCSGLDVGTTSGPPPQIPDRYAAVLRRAHEEWGIPWDEGLSRRLVTARYDVRPGQPLRCVYEVVAEATIDGASRYLLLLNPRLYGLDGPAVVEGLTGCRTGRVGYLPGGASMHELELPRPLSAGEVAILRFEVQTPGRSDLREVTRFGAWSIHPTDLLACAVRFPRGHRPRWYRRSILRLEADGEFVTQDGPVLPVRGRDIAAVASDVGVGQVWVEWSDDRESLRPSEQ
ncbi:hypothetical protein JSY14_11330 [Brachybacterium sp. EF45031]|uniref:hypothetical protein n=1 Tax=Brachybacterium sillae TaxID=2810536 RepID=UPI00217D0D4D|nr:hypothetical protein [Brachybacterium sillae]MCS6712581.1 hypothetical protein [Brachybacterium sillae]